MITPSAIFEQYCSPTSDGKLLCDITKVGRELAFDIDEALAAIGEGGGQDVDEDSSNVTIEQDIPFVSPPSFGNSNNSVVDMNETMATMTTMTTTESDSSSNVSSNVSSPEVFPLLLGSVLIIATLVFTLITLATVYQRRRKSHHNNNGQPHTVYGDEGSSTVLPDSNSWVEESESSDEEDWPSSSEQKVLMSWNKLSCSYPTKNGDENITLKDVTGHIKYKELVAIMGGSG